MKLVQDSPKSVYLPNPEVGTQIPSKKERRKIKVRLRRIWHSFTGFLKRLVRFPFKTRRRKIVSFSVIFILVLVILLGIVVPILAFYPNVKLARAAGDKFTAAYGKQDLEAMESSLKELDVAVSGLEEAWGYLVYFKVIPFANRYYADAGHLITGTRLGVGSGLTIISTLIPYSEILGLKPGFGKQITVEQQLANLLSTLPKVAGELDHVWENLFLIRSELEQVDFMRYPQELRGVKVRFWLEQAQTILDDLEPILAQGRLVLEDFPQMLGSKSPRTYLVVFQNDGEIRATGGFMTAFSLLTVSKGKVIRNDVYPGVYVHPFQRYEAPPPPLGKYLGVERWFFHDLNFYPNFPTSAKKMMDVWNRAGLSKVSGIVTVNTDTATSLLDITGPLEIPSYNLDLTNSGLPEPCRGGGRRFTRENLVCRLEFYVEKSPYRTPGVSAKTDILGKLSEAVIEKITSSSAEIWPKLVDLMFTFFKRRSVMVYSPDKVEQGLLSSLGWAGELVAREGGDYLHINDNNYGGLKSDIFMTGSVTQSLELQNNGVWRKTVSIKYYNPQKYDNWLSGIYHDYVRIYVPKGSKLIDVGGESAIWTSPSTPSREILKPGGWSEAGKTVFGAFFTIAPQKEKILTFVYDLPEGVVGDAEWQVYVQRQSGTNIGLVSTKFGDKLETVDLTTDAWITLPISD